MIRLEKGWTFRRVKDVYKHADDDEYIRDPAALPIGGTQWNPEISWRVSPADGVHDGWWVEIERAKGVH